MKIFFIFVFSFSVAEHAFSGEASNELWGTANPICSKNGLRIFFLNGISNTEDGAKASKSEIEAVIASSSPQVGAHEKILDENRVKYDVLWNKTWYPMDLAVFANQKLKELQVKSDHIYERLKGVNIPDKYSSPDDKRNDYEKDFVQDEELKRLIESYKKKLSDSLVDQFAARIIQAIEQDGEKVVVVAHSQGNMYLNEAYLRIIGTRPDLIPKLDHYFAMIYVASPAHNYLTDVNGASIKLKSDMVTSWMGEAAQYKVISSHPFWYVYHEFSGIYLRDDVIVEGGYSMKDVFLKALYEKTRSFYSNCCRTSSGNREANGGLHFPGGGWVSGTVGRDSYVHKTGEVCDSSTVERDVGELSHIRGNSKISGEVIEQVDLKNMKPYVGFAKGVYVPMLETPMVLIENSTISGGVGLWVEDEPGYDTMVSPGTVVRNSTIEGSAGIRNTIIENSSSLTGTVRCEEAKIDDAKITDSVINDSTINKTVVKKSSLVGSQVRGESISGSDVYDSTVEGCNPFFS